jgi:hypothetical protein
MRYIIVSTFFITAGLVSTASAASLTCNPAVQNWQNGSQFTCPYDSNGLGPQEVKVVASAPPRIVVDEEEEVSESTVD